MGQYDAHIEWHGEAITEAVRAAAVQGLTSAAEHLLQVSRTEVPIDEATLERSGVASVDEDKMIAAVSYDTPYAKRQHEDMTLRHASGRKAKYLEDPFNNEQSTFQELIATPIRRAIQGG